MEIKINVRHNYSFRVAGGGDQRKEMTDFFRRLFNVYSGEERNAIFFAILGFLWALGVTAGQSFADVLFLLHVGADSLPTAYTITSCIMVLTAAFFLKIFNKFHIQHIFISVLLAGVGFYSLAYLGILANLGVDSTWFWYVLKVSSYILLTLVITCFWTLIDQYFHLQDAKRLYSLFTCSEFLGAAVTGLIMRSGWIDFQHLTLMIVGLLLLTIYWMIRKISQIKPIYDNEDAEDGNEEEKGSFRTLIRTILGSRFTLLLMLLNFLIYVLLVITEYSYMYAFGKHFAVDASVIGGEENTQLMQFLGDWTAIVGVIYFIFGLFFYSRCVRRFGIINLVLLTPIILVFTFTGWTVSSSLMFPIMGFFIVEGMLTVIDDNNFTLLLNAVPAKAKYKVRLMIESFFEPLGMLISSLLIPLVSFDSTILGLILSAFALLVAILLHKQYLKAIFVNLSENAIHFQRSVKDWFTCMNKKEEERALNQLFEILNSNDEQAQFFAIETLVEYQEKGILIKLLQYLDKAAVATKVAFIEMISKTTFAVDITILSRIQTWLDETSDNSLKSTIHLYLIQYGFLETNKILQDLQSSDLNHKGAAIIALKKAHHQLSATAIAANNVIASQHLQSLLESSNEDEVCMGLKVLGIDAQPYHADTILTFLKSPSLKVARTAASSIANIADKHSIRYAPILISKMESTSDSELRLSCLRALGKIGGSFLVKEIIESSVHFRPNERRMTEIIISQMGQRKVPILLAITKDTTMHDRCRMLAGRILGRLALSELRTHLYEIVNVELERAYFYFYHYHTIQSQHPQIDLTLLRDALMSSYQSVIDFIVQLLGVAGESEDCELLSRSLRSPNPKVRSHVVETLEKSCETKIFRVLYPLVADLPHAEKMHAYAKGGFTPLTLPELLDKLSKSRTQGDRMIAAAFRYYLDLPNWRESLREQISTQTELFHPFAHELLET